MTKIHYEVKWLYENIWGDTYTDCRLFENDKDMEEFISQLIQKEGVQKIWKTSIEEITPQESKIKKIKNLFKF